MVIVLSPQTPRRAPSYLDWEFSGRHRSPSSKTPAPCLPVGYVNVPDGHDYSKYEW